MLETHDGGVSWAVLENTPGSGEGVGQYVVDSKVWLWGKFDSVFRTEDAGKTWSKVSDTGGNDQIVQVKSTGTWFAPSLYGLKTSTDNTKTWQPVANGPRSEGIAVGDGMLFTSYFLNTGADAQFNPYFTTQETNATGWGNLEKSSFKYGGWLIRYDSDHHILYSTNGESGFWRRRIK